MGDLEAREADAQGEIVFKVLGNMSYLTGNTREVGGPTVQPDTSAAASGA